MMHPSISLVIPCYNESNRLLRLQNGLKQFIEKWQGDFEIIIVDDGSEDETFKKISNHIFFTQLISQNRFQLIQQENTGKGGALKLGVSHASKDFILTLDADMATQPTELLYWIELRKGFQANEILIGSRELKTSIVKDSIKRKFVGNVFNLMIRWLVGLSILDTQCGFKLYPSLIAKELFTSLQTQGWAHDVELLAKASKLNIQIIEMPITWNAIEGSKIRIARDSWKMFWEIVQIRKLI